MTPIERVVQSLRLAVDYERATNPIDRGAWYPGAVEALAAYDELSRPLEGRDRVMIIDSKYGGKGLQVGDTGEVIDIIHDELFIVRMDSAEHTYFNGWSFYRDQLERIP